jgi:hypothetical protein
VEKGSWMPRMRVWGHLPLYFHILPPCLMLSARHACVQRYAQSSLRFQRSSCTNALRDGGSLRHARSHAVRQLSAQPSVWRSPSICEQSKKLSAASSSSAEPPGSDDRRANAMKIAILLTVITPLIIHVPIKKKT